MLSYHYSDLIGFFCVNVAFTFDYFGRVQFSNYSRPPPSQIKYFRGKLEWKF